MNRLIVLALVLAGGLSPTGKAAVPSEVDSLIAGPNAETTVDWPSRIAYQRGIEAVIWGVPAVSMLTMRDANFSLGGGYNTLYYMSRIPTPRAEALTPNNQTPYATVFITTRGGPVVLEIPPASERTAIFGSAVNVWQEPLVDVGPAGEDKGTGGRYLFLPPGYEGDTPDGFFIVPMTSYDIFVALRCIPLGGASFEEAAEYSRNINAYPLAQAEQPPPGNYVDTFDEHLPTLPVFDLGFFNYLVELLNTEPVFERDRVMTGMLKSIGIEKGTPFAPAPALRSALQLAASDGYDYLEHTFETPGYSLETYWPQRQWLGIRAPSAEGFVFDDGDQLLLDARGSLFHWGTFFPVNPGRASAYLIGLRDSDGAALSGAAQYRLRVPAAVPVRNFWSVIAYNRQTKAFIYSDSQRVGLSSYDKPRMTMNNDDSVDIYFGAAPPAGLESNWIPSAGNDFFVIFRFYGPDKAVFDRSFVLPDIERLN